MKWGTGQKEKSLEQPNSNISERCCMLSEFHTCFYYNSVTIWCDKIRW